MGGVHIDWGGANFRFPARMENKIGKDTIWRGRYPKGEGGVNMHFWDHIQDCKDVPDCPLRPCTYYSKISSSGVGRRQLHYCLMQKYYLKAIISDGLEYIHNTGMDYDKVAMLGFHLIPLYNQLFQHKLEILRLDGWSRDPEDESRAHPVYREFRETCEAIERLWTKLGRKVPGAKKIAPPPDKKTEYMDKLMGRPERQSRRTIGVDMEEGKGMTW